MFGNSRACRKRESQFKVKAQLNFSGPLENISTLWQYFLLQFYKTSPNLTLPDQMSIPFPNLAWGTHPSPAGGHLNPGYFKN